jgi:hypothetical protein
VTTAAPRPEGNALPALVAFAVGLALRDCFFDGVAELDGVAVADGEQHGVIFGHSDGVFD